MPGKCQNAVHLWVIMLGLLAITTVGYDCRPDRHRNNGLGALASLAGIGIAFACLGRRETRAEWIAALGLLLQSAIIVKFHRVVFSGDELGVFLSVAWLSPFIFGIVVLVRRQLWLIASGYALAYLGGVNAASEAVCFHSLNWVSMVLGT